MLSILDPTSPTRFATTPPPDQIEFTRLPSKALLKSLDAHLGHYPSTVIRFYSNRGDWTSLKFLHDLPNVRLLLLQNTNMAKPINDLTPLSAIDELQMLHIPCIANRKMDFSPLLKFAKCLCNVSIWIDEEAHASSYFQILQQLKQVTALGLPFCDFAEIAPLKRLTSLNLGTGPFENIEALHALTKVKQIRAIRSKLRSVAQLFAFQKLETIELLHIPNCGVTSLPEDSVAKFVYIDGFNSLLNLDSLVTFSRLNTLVVRHSHLPPNRFAFLNKCRKIQRVFVEYATRSRYAELRSIVDSSILLDHPVFPDQKTA